MKKRRFKKRWIIAALFIIIEIVLHSSYFSMRMSPEKFAAELTKHGQKLSPVFEKLMVSEAGREVHFVRVAASDSLPLAIFVHGSPGSMDNALDYLADTNFTKNFQCVAIDRLGFGYSGFGEAEHSLEKQAAVLRPILEKYGSGKKVVLVGHSLGGPLVCRAAMDFGEKLTGIVIVAGSVSPDLEPEEWWRGPLDWPLVRWLLPAALRVSNQEIKTVKPELELMRPLWSKINCAVTVMHAKDDMLVPFSNVAFMQKMLTATPRLEIKTFEKGNHFIMWSEEKSIKEAVFQITAR